MRRLLLVLLGTARRDACQGVTPRDGAIHMVRSGIALISLALLVVGCAGHPLVPKEQALAIKTRGRTLAPHARAIHEAIRQSGSLGALAFLDAGDGHLVVLPGNTPAEAWARYSASPSESSPGRVLVPSVVSFVYSSDVPKVPETVTHVFLQQQQTLGTSLIALDTEQRHLSDSIAATRQETQQSIAAARQDMQKALNSLAEDLDAARKFMLQTADLGRLNQKALTSLAEDLDAARAFMLQTAQLGWLNHELNVQNANGIRKAARASEQLTSDSARLADTMRQLSESLADQLKELAGRLDSIQSKLSDVK